MQNWFLMKPSCGRSWITFITTQSNAVMWRCLSIGDIPVRGGYAGLDGLIEMDKW